MAGVVFQGEFIFQTIAIKPSAGVKPSFGQDRRQPKFVGRCVDFVGEKGTPDQAMAMLRKGGTYYVVGYGGMVRVPAIDMIFDELNIVGTLVGNYTELFELMVLAAEEKVKLATTTYKLDQVNEAMHDLAEGRLTGRAVLVP
ncbi:MAG: zinc-binding dehydrogenase [Planctomycetes bacterium]|nr:zinc-binding dehydrogenase [Planctomycetota bacterium]